MARVGGFLAVRYDVPGPVVWHERLVVGIDPRRAGRYAIVTPDGDEYTEGLANDEPDVAEVRRLAFSGALLDGVPGRAMYRFRALPAAEAFERMVLDGSLSLGVPAPVEPVSLSVAPGQAAVMAFGGWARPGPGGTGAAPPAVGGGSAGATSAGTAVALESRGGVAPASPRDVWVAAEKAAGFGVGDVLPVTGHEAVAGEKGVFVTTEGAGVFMVRLPAARTVAEYVADRAAEEADARVLPVAYGASGARGRSFFDAAKKCQMVEFSDFPLPGPRTVHWCLSFLERRQGGPMEHHRWWMSSTKLQPNDWGVAEHENALRGLLFALEYDQVDATNLAVLEVAMRRAQLVEYHYEKKGRAAGSKDQAKASGLTREEASYFVGTHRLTGETMVCPELVAWVGAELGRDVEVVKQLRKAREEARLAKD